MGKPVDNPCICVMLRRTAGAVTEKYDKALKDQGISIHGFSILANLSIKYPVTTTELALKVGLDRTTMVRNLKKLKDAGYVKNVSGSGERDNQLILTESGRNIRDNAKVCWDLVQKEFIDRFGAESMEEFMQMLYEMQKM